MARFAHSLSRIAPVLWLVSTACTAPRASDEQRSEPSSAPAVAPQHDVENEVGAKNAPIAPSQAQPQAASAIPADHKTEQKTAEDKQDAQPQLTATKTGPSVKRLIMASDVKDREPIELGQAQSKQPVVAFVELNNASGAESSVVITFEHENGKKVGFIELNVPGESPRHRTWGRTRNIDESGIWTAVVRTKEGEELARQSFSVTG